MNKPQMKPATFVLVHGAWHGGWCWKKVKSLLEAEGRTVFTPTLTGLGERSHLLSPQIDLSTHIEDIIAVLEYEDLYDVILVGHSYAGMVITSVAEKFPHRLAHLVYLDAYLPQDKKSMMDYFQMPLLDEIVKARGEGWKVPLPGRIEDLGVINKEDINWVSTRVGDHPYKTFTEKVNLTISVNHIAKTFIRLTNFPWYTEAGNRAKRMGFNYYEMLEGGHDAMISKPSEIAALLLHLVQNNNKRT